MANFGLLESQVEFWWIVHGHEFRFCVHSLNITGTEFSRLRPSHDRFRLWYGCSFQIERLIKNPIFWRSFVFKQIFRTMDIMNSSGNFWGFLC